MMACPSTRSEVRGALAKTVMLYLHLIFLPLASFWASDIGTSAAIGRGRTVDCPLWTDTKCEEYVYYSFRGGGGGGNKACTAWRFHHLHNSNNADECVLHS
jgi:hypothetical protein